MFASRRRTFRFESRKYGKGCGIFTKGEYSHAYRLRASSTRSAAGMRTFRALHDNVESSWIVRQNKREITAGGYLTIKDSILARTARSVSRGSNSPPDCYSLPLPFESAMPINKREITAGVIRPSRILPCGQYSSTCRLRASSTRSASEMRTFCALRNKVEHCNGPPKQKRDNREGYLSFVGGRRVYHHCERKYSLWLMIYTFGDDIPTLSDDIPLLSQWIKQNLTLLG